MADDPLTPFLQSNTTWCETFSHKHPDILSSCSKGQSPPLLFLGCSDSRCPETTFFGTHPGQVFTHRNVANVLHPSDPSFLAALTYAVTALKVKCVVVCGHTSCGGVAAALGGKRVNAVIDNWLAPVRQLRREIAEGKKAGGEGEVEMGELIEANVRRGVQVVRENADVMQAEKERGLSVRGLVYDVGTGKLKEVDCGEGEAEREARWKVLSLD